MKRTTGLLIAFLSVFALPVLAQTATAPAKDPAATPGIDERQVNQQQRIDQGVKSGELTGKEAARLEKGQDHVQTLEDKAKVDGRVTQKERERIHHAQNKQSKKVYQQKHDRQDDLNHDGKRDALAGKR